MMDKWGLQGMASFDQKSVKSKERFPIEGHQDAAAAAATPASSAQDLSVAAAAVV
jgi:hypothetical protein